MTVFIIIDIYNILACFPHKVSGTDSLLQLMQDFPGPVIQRDKYDRVLSLISLNFIPISRKASFFVSPIMSILSIFPSLFLYQFS